MFEKNAYAGDATGAVWQRRRQVQALVCSLEFMIFHRYFSHNEKLCHKVKLCLLKAEHFSRMLPNARYTVRFRTPVERATKDAMNPWAWSHINTGDS